MVTHLFERIGGRTDEQTRCVVLHACCACESVARPRDPHWRPSNVFAGSIFRRAFGALKLDRAERTGLLQNSFVRLVVHARLANKVRRMASRIGHGACQDEHTGREFVQNILGAVGTFLFDFGKFGGRLSQLVLEPVNFITGRRLLFLQSERGILHVYYAIVDRLLHLSKLQVISSSNRRLCDIDSVLQAGDGGRYGHDRHLVPRLVICRARPRRNHHSALAAGAGVRWESA